MIDKTNNYKVWQMPSLGNQDIYWTYLQEYKYEITYCCVCNSKGGVFLKDP